jgi:hypothetical protein
MSFHSFEFVKWNECSGIVRDCFESNVCDGRGRCRHHVLFIMNWSEITLNIRNAFLIWRFRISNCVPYNLLAMLSLWGHKLTTSNRYNKGKLKKVSLGNSPSKHWLQYTTWSNLQNSNKELVNFLQEQKWLINTSHILQTRKTDS